MQFSQNGWIRTYLIHINDDLFFFAHKANITRSVTDNEVLTTPAHFLRWYFMMPLIACAAMKKNILPLLTLLLLTPMLAPQAALSSDEKAAGWKSNIELGAVQTSGNTKTFIVNAKGKFVHEGIKLRDTITGSANNSTDNNRTTAESYDASLQEDWKITEADYLFIRYGFQSDRFAGFRRRTSETIGYGRDMIKTATLHWKLELGGGLRQTKFVNNSSKNEAVMRAATGLNWKVSEAAVFTQDVSSEGGKNGWATESITALQHKLNSHLSSKIAVKVEHNSQVTAPVKKTDVETAVTLVVNF